MSVRRVTRFAKTAKSEFAIMNGRIWEVVGGLHSGAMRCLPLRPPSTSLQIKINAKIGFPFTPGGISSVVLGRGFMGLP